MGSPFICRIGHVDSPPPDYQKGVTATVEKWRDTIPIFLTAGDKKRLQVQQ